MVPPPINLWFKIAVTLCSSVLPHVASLFCILFVPSVLGLAGTDNASFRVIMKCFLVQTMDLIGYSGLSKRGAIQA